MNNFDTIKNLWQTQSSEILPKAEEFTKIVENFNQKKRKNTIILIISTLLLLIIMIGIVCYFNHQFLITKIGEFLLFIGVNLILFQKFTILKKINAEAELNNVEFINLLKEKQVKDFKKGRNFQLLALIIIGIGYSLFMYESVYQSPLLLFLNYLFFITYLLFMWFYFRPYINKKQQEKIKKLIQSTEKINKQIYN